jgi:sugar phosphate isomerase/epimerase
VIVKLGLHSAILPDCGLEEVVNLAQATGYSCVEVACWPTGRANRRYAGVTHIDAGKLDKHEAEKIKDLFVSSGLGISALVYAPNPLSPDQDEAVSAIEHLKRVILAAEVLDVGAVVTFVGRDKSLSVEDNWMVFEERWPPMIAFAEDHGVRIAIENCPMLFTKDEWPGGKNLAYCPAIWRRMFEMIPSPYFGLAYDPSHLIWQHIDYIKPIREFASRILHVHAKDARLDKERLDEVGILGYPLQFHTTTIPGHGDVDWRRFLCALRDIDFRGTVSVEVEDRAFEHSREGREEALLQSATYLRQFIVE